MEKQWCLTVGDPLWWSCGLGVVRGRLRDVFCVRRGAGCGFGCGWARLRCVLWPRAGACFFSFRGFRLVTSPRCGGGFLAMFASGFRWCLAVLSPSPGGCCSGCVRARLRRVFCLRAGACFFSFRGFRLVTSPRCGGGFFALFASGFRWCLAVLSPSPGGCCSGCVRARLRRVFCLRAGACFFSFRSSDLSLRHAAGEGFWLCLRPDLGGVWLFWVHRREVAALGVSGLGCVAFSVYVLGPVSSPLGVSDLSLRHAAGEGFLLCLRPDLGGVWLFWVHRREVAALGVSGLGCVAFSVYVLGPVSSPLGVSDLSLRHAAGEGFWLCLRPDLGGVWLFWAHRREVAALGVSGLGCVAFSVYVLGPCFFSFRGFRLVTSPRCGGGFFAMFASGFRWCLAVLSPSPGGCCSGRVRARLWGVGGMGGSP